MSKVMFSDEGMNAVRMAVSAASTANSNLLPREMLQNGIDAGAKNIKFFRDPQFPDKLVMSDDGRGIENPDLLIKRLALPGSMRADAHHFGVGLRMLAMGAAKKNDGSYPYLVFMTQGLKGPAYRLDVYFDGYSLKKVTRMAGKSGSKTVIMGNGPEDQTLMRDTRSTEGSVLWVDKAINSRYLTMPKGVKVQTIAWGNEKRKGPGSALQTCYGLLHYMQKDGCQILPAVVVDGFKVTTVLVPEALLLHKKNTSKKTNFKPKDPVAGEHRIGGQVLHVLDNEVYSLETGSTWPVERFKITVGKPQVTLIVEPVRRDRFLPDQTRQSIHQLDDNGEPVPLDLTQLGSHFLAHAPAKLKEFLRKEQRDSSKRGDSQRNSNLIAKTIMLFGTGFRLFRKGDKGKSELQSVTEVTGFEKGLSQASVDNRPGDQPQVDVENPFPSERRTAGDLSSAFGLGMLVANSGRRRRVVATSGVPRVEINFVQDEEHKEVLIHFANFDKSTGVANVDFNESCVWIDFLLELPIAKERGVTRERLLQKLESLTRIRPLTLIAMSKQLEGTARHETFPDYLSDAAMTGSVTNADIMQSFAADGTEV